MGPDVMIFIFWILSSKPAFSLSSFTFFRRLFGYSLLSAIRLMSSAYLRLLIFLLAILIPACASSILTFHIIYSAYKLNKQGDNIQLWHAPFPIWNQSVVPCLVLTVSSSAYRFLKRQIRWSGIPISLGMFQFVVIHRAKGFSIVNEAEIDVFLKFPCFFYDTMNVGNLISGSSASSKSNLKSGSSPFTYYWSLAWRILSITLLVVRWVQLCSSFNILWDCLSLESEWKLTFSNPVVTAEFSKFAGILSAALSQHHI